MAERFLIFDRGAFVPFAQALASSTDAEVLYFSEWREVASMSKGAMVGRDVPGVTRVDSFWNNLRKSDTVCFPDVGDGDLQHWLREQGYHVWGSGRAEMLELDRWEFTKLLKRLDMPVIPTKHFIGVEPAAEYLQDHENQYVKTSFFRGDFETYHHITWELTRPWFLKLVARLGPHANDIEILVQGDVPGDEIGYDGFSIDGKFPVKGAWGIECKDQGYIGYATDELPQCLAEANDSLAPALEKLGARCCYSNEVRVTEDGTAYISDPCLRCGSPPFGAQSLWVTNWADIVHAGARGDIVEPTFAAPYAAEIEMHSPWLEEDWLAFDMPPEVVPWVRLRRPCVVNDQWWSVPHEWLDIAGSAIGLGQTAEAAIDAAMDIADSVKAFQLEYNHHVKEELLQMWQDAQRLCLPQEDSNGRIAHA